MRKTLAIPWFVTLLACCAGCETSEPWTEQPMATDATFRDIFFLDSSRGWIVGGGYPVEGGIIGSTVDGGRTWTFESGLIGGSRRSHSLYLQAVQFLDEQRGFIAAGNGRILRTVDGGKHWHPVHRGSRFLFDLQFVDELQGWAVGHSSLLRTTDGGESWKLQEPSDTEPRVSGRAIQFLDRDLGWVVGGAGAIYQTSNGGESWRRMRPPKSGEPVLTALSFVDVHRGWVVGEHGTVLHTVDGGWTWSQQITGTDAYLTGVHFFDQSEGWAIGFRRDDSSSILLRTENGGTTWKPHRGVEGQALHALFFLGHDRGWAAGERLRPHTQRLLRYEGRAGADSNRGD